MGGIAILGLAIVGIAAYFLFPQTASASVSDTPSSANLPTLDEVFAKWGAQYNVDPILTKSIARNESSLNPLAVNSADNESLGLMQILCRPDGHGGCTNKFNVDGWSEATREKLLTPDFNVQIGTQILAWNIQQYGLPKGIAVYNKWNERTSSPEGPFGNQSYVDRVLNFYKEYSA